MILITALSQILTAKRLKGALRSAETVHRFAENARKAGELVRSQGLLRAVTDRFTNLRHAALHENMVNVDWSGSFSTFNRAFRLSSQSLVLAMGAWLVLQGQISAGAMISASILPGHALSPMKQIIACWPQIGRARQARAVLEAFLRQIPEEQFRTRLPRPEERLNVSGGTVR